jgi:hypothetical protein
MGCTFCQQESSAAESEPIQHRDCSELRGCVPLFPNPQRRVCPRCGTAGGDDSPESENPRHEELANLDCWQWELDEQLADVQRLLASKKRRDPAHILALGSAPKDRPTKFFQHLQRPATAMPLRGTATRRALKSHSNAGRLLFAGGSASLAGLIMIFWYLLGGPFACWTAGLAAILSGQTALLVGSLLLLLDVHRRNQEVSAKVDTTIAGLHVLRKENKIAQLPETLRTATPEPDTPNLPLQRLAFVKERIVQIARSLPA